MKSDMFLRSHYEKADQVMLALTYALTCLSLALASWYSTWVAALTVGVGTSVAMTFIYMTAKGTALCRAAMAAGFMVLTALHIHQGHGMNELHFGVFALLAMLLFYRDVLPIIVAAVVIAVHHLTFYFLQNSGAGIWILSENSLGFSIILVHSSYVVIEGGLLIWFAHNLKSEAIESAEITYVSNKITSGKSLDLTARTSGATNLLQNFNEFLGKLDALASKVRDSSATMSSETLQLEKLSHKVREMSTAQQQETDMIATAVEEMTASINEVYSNAKTAEDSSSQLEQDSQEAINVSQRTEANVSALSQSVNEAVESIESLNEQTNSIGSVLDVIRGIAEQTNLLALNAAIEAARAGEQGRGFAVVADEVRTLAQRTQQSTQEIDSMIEQLQTGSEKAVGVIATSREKGELCVSETRQAMTLMSSVNESICEIFRVNTLISASTQEQRTVVGEVSRNVANILDSSTAVANETGQTANSVDRLAQLSRNLDELANSFYSRVS